MHSCPVKVCDEGVPDHLLMCKAHWRMVPADIQREVYQAYHRYEANKSNERLVALRAAQKKAKDYVDAKLVEARA